MYLSRIQLNPRRREARWLLASPQRLHAAVLAAFPDPPTGDLDGEPRVLWRLDTDDAATLLYVVSPEQPDFAHLAEQAGWPTTERGTVKPYGPFLDRLAAGQRWAFRITANPTRYVKDLTSGKARRLGHVTVAQQAEWLAARSQSLGFSLVSAADDSGVDDGSAVEPPPLALTVSHRVTHSFTRENSKKPVTLATAQFDGVLEIADVGAFRGALVGGIGPAKAYGCGLMTLARPEP